MQIPALTRLAALTVALPLALVACTQAPVTGRDQLIILPEAQTTQLGADAYQELKNTTPVSTDPAYVQPVEEIGRRVAAVSPQPNLDWEFTVFEDETPNAFALPGGKVGVNTGLFTVAKNKDQLAAVMAHEVGHVMARHSAERMSRQTLLNAGLGVIGTQSANTAEILAQAAQLGLVLPFTRTQESEADEIGLMLMARAGYDPRAAIDLWRNFDQAGGSRPPEFLSTHPSPGTRIQRLQALMPRAMEIYRQSGGAA